MDEQISLVGIKPFDLEGEVNARLGPPKVPVESEKTGQVLGSFLEVCPPDFVSSIEDRPELATFLKGSV